VRKDKVVSTSNREIAILLTASFFSIGNQGGPPFDLLQSFVRGGPAHLTCNRLANLPTTIWLQSAERTALGGNRVLTNRQPKPRSWPADVSATKVTLGVDASNSAHVRWSSCKTKDPHSHVVVHEATHLLHYLKPRHYGLHTRRHQERFVDVDFRYYELFAFSMRGVSARGAALRAQIALIGETSQFRFWT